MTYNVHSCVGSDARLDPGRVLRVIEAADPDIVALQELDVGLSRSGLANQPAWLAERLGMSFSFAAARNSGDGHYGNAVLSRHSVSQLGAACLPALKWRWNETRCMQRVRISGVFGELELVNTHLSLRPRERALQTAAVLEHWRSVSSERAVLCGDLNAVPGSRAYTSISRALTDAQLLVDRPVQRTWPSVFPLLRLDHVFLGTGFEVYDARVPTSLLARLASDHLPVVVDLGFELSGHAGQVP